MFVEYYYYCLSMLCLAFINLFDTPIYLKAIIIILSFLLHFFVPEIKKLSDDIKNLRSIIHPKTGKPTYQLTRAKNYSIDSGPLKYEDE